MTRFTVVLPLLLISARSSHNSFVHSEHKKRLLLTGTCGGHPTPSVAHGRYVCDTKNTCQLKCADGYKLDSSRGDTIRCVYTHGSRWSPSHAGSCTAITCTIPPNPRHGSYACATSKLVVGSTCTLSCSHRYQIDSNSSSAAVTCQTNGTWSDQPSCRDLSCHGIPTVANGLYVCPSGNAVPGTTCQLYCSQGHHVVGNDTLTCGANQQWSAPATCEEAQCSPTPQLQDGAYICPPGPPTHGTMCQLQCAVGHRPVADITNITCRIDGTWSPATTCTEGCPRGSHVKLGPLGGKSCETCAVGTYQSKVNSASCDPCPAGWTTLSTGSVSVDSCMSLCHPGTYSPNGFDPCHLCHLGTYQNITGGQVCHLCPAGQTTKHVGSTSVSECVSI